MKQSEMDKKYAVVEHHDGERTTIVRTNSLMRARVRALMLIREHRSVVIEKMMSERAYPELVGDDCPYCGLCHPGNRCFLYMEDGNEGEVV